MAHASRQSAGLLGILFLGLAACASPGVTPAPTTGPSPSATSPSSPDNSVDATLKEYRSLIGIARLKHPYADSADRMYAVMMCESSGRASVVNKAGPYTGLFQYSTATWNGAWNIYRDQGILDPKAQILATALAWQRNMQNQWGCYRKTR